MSDASAKRPRPRKTWRGGRVERANGATSKGLLTPVHARPSPGESRSEAASRACSGPRTFLAE
jgi:hypothetical protein